MRKKMPRYYYNTVWREIFTELFDLVVPPRATELVVRALTLERLHTLGGEDGLPYHDPGVTALVWEMKYHATRRSARLAGAYISETLLAAMSEELGMPLLIPVPMHASRRRERGHNQTELLCLAALPYLQHIEYAPRALKRVVDTKTQQGLPRQERLRNVKHSMRAQKMVSGRACIVVDDVTTTGATLDEAKRALAEAGARAVHTVALARS